MKQFLWILVSLLLSPWLTAQELTYKQVDNLPYSTSTDAYAKERCQLDLYYPEGATGFLTVVWFHGGGLTSGNKFVPEELKEKGIAVVAVNYRLLPKASLSDCINDAAAAVAWTYREIERYGGDRHKIFVSGHSAGGYLTNMIGLDKKWLAKYQVDADSLAALVPYSGHAISHFAYREAKGMKVTQPSIDEFAPLYYVRPDAPPLVIISGDREKELLGRYEETAYLWRMMKVVGHPACDLYELDGYDHGSMANPAHKILLDYVRKLCPDNFYEMNRSQAVTAFVTTTDRRRDFAKEYVPFGQTNAEKPLTITLDPTKRFQTMDGFGAALTGSTCYNLLRMAPEDRKRFLTETFSEREGMGYSYIRISIGCSDFSLSEYTCCDEKGIEHFALQSEEIYYVIPVLKEVLAINPKLKILGSPWTCPRWMKVNNLQDLQPFESWTSGQLNPAYYQDYATYFVKWIQAMEAEGIPIEAITPQNEPLNRGNSASLFMGWEEQQAFVRDALGPQLKAAGLQTKIYAFDHNYNYDNMLEQQGYPMKLYEDPNAASFLTGAAYHNYGGDRAELKTVGARFPQKELIFTETSIGMWNDGRNLSKRLMEDMAEVALGTVNNGCKAVIVWNLMLDNDRGPNRKGGCQTCYGAVDIERSDYKTITRNSHYYIIGHLSAVVKPGAVRIATSESKQAGITYAAFENPDRSHALVLLNDSDQERQIEVSDGLQPFTYKVPAHAVVSFKWKK